MRGGSAGRLGRTLAITVAAVALTAAVAFGAWHVVVGGLLNGNPRAAEFGAGLAGVASVLLVGLAIVVRRLGPS